jgi:hypothetical protein
MNLVVNISGISTAAFVGCFFTAGNIDKYKIDSL